MTVDSFYLAKTNSGDIYSISPSTTIYWGATTRHGVCYCRAQYARFYIDYVPTSQDQMINLALMNPESKSEGNLPL